MTLYQYLNKPREKRHHQIFLGPKGYEFLNELLIKKAISLGIKIDEDNSNHELSKNKVKDQ